MAYITESDKMKLPKLNNSSNNSFLNNLSNKYLSGTTSATPSYLPSIKEEARPTINGATVSGPMQFNPATNTTQFQSSSVNQTPTSTPVVNNQQQTQQVNPYDTVVNEAKKIKEDNIARINQSYTDQTDLINKQKEQDLQRLKSILESRQSSITNQISGARNKFQPQREQVDVRRAQDLQRAREMLAAQGVFGGDNLTSQMGINTQASSNISGIDQAQADYVNNLEEESRQLQYTYDSDQAAAISKAMELQRSLLADKANKLSSEENTYVTNLKDAMEKKKAQDNADRAREDSLYAAQGLVYDPTTKTYVKTSSQKQTDLGNERTEADRLKAEEDKKKQDYVSTISRFYNDFQAEINNIQNDGDPNNDWQIPLLQAQQQAKRGQMLQNAIQTIGQYGNDYQAEINNRQATPDTNDDALIPYLKIAQLDKKANIQKAQLTQKETQQKNALELWKQIGYATPEISAILGIPQGTTTQDYMTAVSDSAYKQGMLSNDTLKTQYDINKPYYNPNTENKEKTKSDYFDEYDQMINNKVASLSGKFNNNKGQWEPDPNSDIYKSGTQAHKAVYNEIMNSDITPTEKELLFKKYKIPY